MAVIVLELSLLEAVCFGCSVRKSIVTAHATALVFVGIQYSIGTPAKSTKRYYVEVPTSEGKGLKQKKKSNLWLFFPVKVYVSALFRSANQKLMETVIQTINEGKILPLVLFVPHLL